MLLPMRARPEQARMGQAAGPVAALRRVQRAALLSVPARAALARQVPRAGAVTDRTGRFSILKCSLVEPARSALATPSNVRKIVAAEWDPRWVRGVVPWFAAP